MTWMKFQALNRLPLIRTKRKCSNWSYLIDTQTLTIMLFNYCKDFANNVDQVLNLCEEKSMFSNKVVTRLIKKQLKHIFTLKLIKTRLSNKRFKCLQCTYKLSHSKYTNQIRISKQVPISTFIRANSTCFLSYHQLHN